MPVLFPILAELSLARADSLLAVCGVALGLSALLARARLAPDTLLSICAFTALSAGLVARERERAR